MRAFTDLSGGSLAMTSAPGAGTSIVAALGEGPTPVATVAPVSPVSPVAPVSPTAASDRRGSRATGPIVGDVDAAAVPHLRLVDSPSS